MTLLIAMPGLRLPENEAEVPAMLGALPVLPALAVMLARARRLPVAVDWRAGVLRALGAPAGLPVIPPVAVAARVMPVLRAGTALCFATPLHVVAGISRVHLPPDGWLRFEDAEAVRWVEAFNREFGGPDLWLHAVTGGWLLAAPCAAAARDASPEVLLGQPLARTPAGNDSERALRRLGAEVEMWLAAHPLNREREARQLPPVNSLWFWGGAHSMELPQLARVPRAVFAVGDVDAWLSGLAAHCAASLGAAINWQSLAPTDHSLLVLAPPLHESTEGYWQDLETRWFEPAARALRTGEISALHLQIGATAWQLPNPSLLRWLRWRRPWYRQVVA